MASALFLLLDPALVVVVVVVVVVVLPLPPIPLLVVVDNQGHRSSLAVGAVDCDLSNLV